MAILNLKKLNRSEKFIAMEELWDDISKDAYDDRLSPKWHLSILKTREKKYKEGDSKFFSLNEVEIEYLNLK